MAEKKETKALEVVSHALIGSVTELVPAHQQIATSMAQMQLNGFDTVQKCTAACWMAHGIGEHPAVFIQNHWALVIKSRLTIEPKWEYMVRKLTETVPGFTFKVLIETDDCAKVSMSDGVNTHEVEYTLEDAKRQGLLSSGGAWASNSREMCFKMAVKRAARRIGVGRAAPWVEMDNAEFADAERDEREVSGAVVEDGSEAPDKSDRAGRASEPEVVGKAVKAEATATQSAAPFTPVDRPVIMRLSDALIGMYGKQKAPIMLQKATLIYNEMVKANTGTDPRTVFKAVADIGPVDAELMIEHIANRSEVVDDRPANGHDAPTFDPAFTKPPADDEPPPAEGAEPEPEGDEYEHFMLAVKRAKKVFGRKFLVEAPPGGKKWWFIDQASFAQAGYAASLKIMESDGEVVVGPDVLKQLTKIMLADCDVAERARRV